MAAARNANMVASNTECEVCDEGTAKNTTAIGHVGAVITK